MSERCDLRLGDRMDVMKSMPDCAADSKILRTEHTMQNDEMKFAIANAAPRA
jgi:hypothetical protein